MQVERLGEQAGHIRRADGRMRTQRQRRVDGAGQRERHRGCMQHESNIVENVRMRQCLDQLRTGGDRRATVAEIHAGKNCTA